MTQPETPKATIDRWLIKCSGQSTDGLISVLKEAFNAMSIIQNKESNKTILIALGHLHLEHSLSLEEEKSKNDIVRNLIFGLIESFHLTIKGLIEDRSRINGNGETSLICALKTVQEWYNKIITSCVQSGDDLISVITIGFEAMLTILKKSDKKDIKRVLGRLDVERSVNFQFERVSHMDPIRELMYGFIESIHLTLIELTREWNQVKETGEKLPEAVAQPVAVSTPHDSSFITVISPSESLANDGSSASSTNGTVGIEEREVKEEKNEMKDEPVKEEASDGSSASNGTVGIEEREVKEEKKEMEDEPSKEKSSTDPTSDFSPDVIFEPPVKKHKPSEDDDISSRGKKHEGKRTDQKEYKRVLIELSDDESVENEEEEETEEEEEKEEEEEMDWVMSCICDCWNEDVGEEIMGCDECLVRWEHVSCIFPRTKNAPNGDYICHTCQPRPTELTPEQAREYQEGALKKYNERKEKQKESDRKRKEKLSRKGTTVFRVIHSRKAVEEGTDFSILYGA